MNAFLISTTTLFIVALSYLLGSIPFGYLLVHIFRGEDVRQSGSGNIGATNVSRKSPALGVLTLLLDALKGSVAVMIAILLNGGDITHPWSPSSSIATHEAIAALFAVLGHMFPVWLKFRGGKGVATGLGSVAILAPKTIVAAIALFMMIVAIFRYVSLGSIVAALIIPVLAWLLHDYAGTLAVLASMSITSLLIVIKHHENIRRLIAGTENRLGKRS
jgi:acyl phosphate:glycerol-3-phosphate acyltransferase